MPKIWKKKLKSTNKNFDVLYNSYNFNNFPIKMIFFEFLIKLKKKLKK